MADRRMFHKHIIDSDTFLDLPVSSQALYFHMAMRADDEGFIGNPKKIQKMIGANDDDAKLLLAKDFLKLFKSGVVVVSHWKIHNIMREDRSKKTIYRKEKNQLALDKNNVYILAQNAPKAETKFLEKKEKKVSAHIILDYVRLDYIKEQLLQETIYSLESDESLNEYLELWLKEKANKKLSPSAYKAALKSKIDKKVKSVLEEFIDWLKIKIKHNFIEEVKGAIIEIDNHQNTILGIEEKDGKVDIYFENGKRGVANSLYELKRIILQCKPKKGQ